MLADNCLNLLMVGAYHEMSSTETAGNSDYTLDATTDEIAITCYAPKAMDIDQIGVYVSALTGTPTYTVQIEGVSATGVPDGSVKSSATAQWAPIGTGWTYITLGAAHTVAVGDLICLRIKDGTTGTDPSGSHNITVRMQSAQYQTNAIPYIMYSTDTGTSWTKVQEVRPLFAFRDSGATTDVFGYPIDPTSYNSVPEQANAANEVSAQKFKLSSRWGKRLKISGMEIRYAAPLGDCYVGIYDSTGAAVVEIAVDVDYRATSASNLQVFFTTPAWIDTNTIYYAGIRYNGVTSWIYVYDLPNSTDRAAFPGYPDNSYSHYNGTSWTDDTVNITHGIGLYVSDIDTSKDGIQKIGGVKA